MIKRSVDLFPEKACQQRIFFIGKKEATPLWSHMKAAVAIRPVNSLFTYPPPREPPAKFTYFLLHDGALISFKKFKIIYSGHNKIYFYNLKIDELNCAIYNPASVIFCGVIFNYISM